MLVTGPTFDDVADLSAGGWEIVLLRGKLPATTGHGVLDATADLDWLRSRWRDGYNIGARVPEGLVVIDTDPRHGGEDNLIALAQGRDLPETLTCFSGRGDGGRHRYFLHPGGQVSGKRLPGGVDLKTHTGYVVLPPSLHPATGRPYRWADETVSLAELPRWLARLLRPTKVMTNRVKTKADNRVQSSHAGDSIADWFTATTTWEQILTGWSEVTGGWRHPHATSPLSATIRHDCLFIFSPNTPFEQTEAEDPHGYTRFRAWAILEHRGDLAAAARAARALRDGQKVSA